MQELTNKKQEYEIKEKPSFDFSKYKSFAYTAIYYTFGLFAGSYTYKVAQTEKLNSIIAVRANDLYDLLLSDFCIYFSVFVVVVFLGFCLIGYPILNIIPSVIGFVKGIRLAYYFINFSVKGIGYSLIMIIPFSALFLTVLSISIEASTELSKNLIHISSNAENTNTPQMKAYLKRYIIYALIVAFCSVLNSIVVFFLNSVVTI